MFTKKKNYTPLTPSEKEDKYFGQIADSLLSLYDRKDELADSWEKPWTAEYTDLPPMNGISEHKYKGEKRVLSLAEIHDKRIYRSTLGYL